MLRQESKVVSGVAVASVSTNPERRRLSKLIEAAMSEAVLKCMHEGITDPSEQKEVMMAARQRVIDEYRTAETQALNAMAEAKAKEGQKSYEEEED